MSALEAHKADLVARRQAWMRARKALADARRAKGFLTLDHERACAALFSQPDGDGTDLVRAVEAAEARLAEVQQEISRATAAAERLRLGLS